MVGTSILQLLSSATTAVEKYLNKFLSFELHLYTMHWVNIQNLFLYFLWYAQRQFPKFINVESCFGPFLSCSLLSVLVCPCLWLYLHFWTNPISTVCASAHLMALTINYLRPPSPPSINITISLLPHKCTVGHTPVFGAKSFSTLFDK